MAGFFLRLVGFDLGEPPVLGKLVDAIGSNTFFMLTHPDEVHQVMLERARDMDGSVRAQAARINEDGYS